MTGGVHDAAVSSDALRVRKSGTVVVGSRRGLARSICVNLVAHIPVRRHAEIGIKFA